jgi:hypothetical protein
MTGKPWRAFTLVSLLLLPVFSQARASENVYLYDPEVASMVDLKLFLSDGTVEPLTEEPLIRQTVEKGPAPAPFPSINIAERSFEQIGASNAQIDGIVFMNHNQHYVANRRALVLWIIKIPNAAARAASEFGEDVTLSLFVDWNQDKIWKESERTTRASLDLGPYLPTASDNIIVYYLTSFKVPDVTLIMESNKTFGTSGKDVRKMWARAVLSYDDFDANAGGGQLFGEYEDYLVSYLVDTTLKPGQ